MKKIVITLTAAFLAFSCAVNEEGPAKQAKYTIYGTINEEDTRVEIVENENGTKFSHHWQSTDKISVFNGASSSSSFEYSVDEGTGTNTASFTGYDQVTANPFYAVYPHNTANAIAETDGNPVFTVSFPSEQAYVQNSYDPTANVYVAKGTESIDGNGIAEDILGFYNTTAYLRLSLYGVDSDNNAATVSKIELSTIGGEPIAGIGTVTLNGDEAVVALADVTENSGTFSTVTLAPTEAVTIGTNADNATNFFFSVPAVNYGESFQGYQIKIYSGSGDTQTYQWRNVSRALSANVVRKMAALEYSPKTTDAIPTLIAGSEFNRIVKELAGTVITDTSKPYYTIDNNVIKIIFEKNKNLTGVTGTDISRDQDGSIIASFKEGVVRIQTNASIISSQSCSYIFMNFQAAREISGLDAIEFGNNSSYINYAFYNDQALESIDLSNMTISKQTTAKFTKSMFYNCKALKTITLWNNYIFTRECDSMFENCESLTAINNLNNLRSSGNYLTSTEKMFNGCSSLKSISIGNYFTTSKVTNMSKMFKDCCSLTSVDISSMQLALVENISSIFENCSSLELIRFETESSKQLLVATNLSRMFAGCSNLEHISYLSSIRLTNVTADSEIDCSYMFYMCSKYTGISSNTISPYFYPLNEGVTIDCSHMFDGCSSATTIIFDASRPIHISKASHMFNECSKLSNLTIAGLNTSKCTTMEHMFDNCDELVSLNLSHFDTRTVTSMQYLCNSCDKLESLDISGDNCSTAAMIESTALKNLICNNKEIRTLRLGEDFLLGAERFTDGIHYLMLPNPDNLTGVLTIYSSSATATNLLQQVGKPSSNYRAVTAVNNGKLVFKSLDGNVEWKYYSDSALTNEITAAEVTKDSYVGLATSSESSEETSNATNGQAQ